ncbi:hypothetical protein N2152v2_008057 [Parachlorella kessleri]
MLVHEAIRQTTVVARLLEQVGPALKAQGLASNTPPDRPPSGTLYLVDRNRCPRFRNDGHSWVKDSGGKNTRERHVKLKVDGVEKINVYYAKQESGLQANADRGPLSRRCYWLLNPDQSKGQAGLVLIHYLHDTAQAAAVVGESSAAGSSPWSLQLAPPQLDQLRRRYHHQQPARPLIPVQQQHQQQEAAWQPLLPVQQQMPRSTGTQAYLAQVPGPQVAPYVGEALPTGHGAWVMGPGASSPAAESWQAAVSMGSDVHDVLNLHTIMALDPDAFARELGLESQQPTQQVHQAQQERDSSVGCGKGGATCRPDPQPAVFPFVVRDYAPRGDVIAGGASMVLAVVPTHEAPREDCQMRGQHIYIRFGSQQVPGQLLRSGCVHCQVPPSLAQSETHEVPLYLALGDGRPVSAARPFTYRAASRPS